VVLSIVGLCTVCTLFQQKHSTVFDSSTAYFCGWK